MASVNYAVGSNWGSGFVGDVTVAGGADGLHGWTVEFDAGFTITDIWGADIVSHVGSHYVIRSVDWTADIAAGAETSFGFQATTGSGGTTTSGLVLNGTTDATATLPELSIANASIKEGTASRQLTFTVTLSQAATAPVSVHYATVDGTAKAGTDYSAASGTLTFAAGETSKTIRVTVIGDTTVEPNETFALRLSAASGATIARATATGTIINDGQAPSDASLAYVVTSNWGTGFIGSMTVTAGSASLSGWTVEFDSSAAITGIWSAEIVSHVGTHYVVRNAAWNSDVAAGKSVTFGFQATPGSGGTSASGFIINGHDAGTPGLPSLSVANASVNEGNSGTHDLAFTIALSAASTAPVTVAYGTANGTATAGSDYTAASGTLTFAPGETSKVVHVQVSGDTAVEANETLRFNLSAPSGATIADGTATGTIVNDDTLPLPALTIGNARFAEGSAAAPGHAAFTVTLSAASSTPVSVHYATADGTAHAGSDYLARSGTLTFAAGETRKTIQISAIGDSLLEANESFKVLLTGPVGATIADGTGLGIIDNDDAAPLPSLSISDVSVIEGDPGAGTAPGWFSTAGNQVVDSSGHPVQIAGVNWFGFESSTLAPHGLWTRGYKEMMDQMVQLGFNTIRLPFSSEMLHTNAAPNGIDFSKNPDLQGLTALQILDKIVAYAGEIGLRIILDHHRSTAGAGVSDNGLWYDAQHSEAQWIADWRMLATRYADNPTVIGADLHNEPYNGTWGGGGATDWAAAAEQDGNAIGAVNPNWLIFVEGIGTYQGQNYWWGGNLMGVKDRPIHLNLGNKLVYSAHDYPHSVYAQPWFEGDNFAASLPAKFDQMWGYIYKQGIAPVYLGEFGTKLTDPKDAPWFEAITSYLSGDFNNDGTSDIPAGHKGISWTYWSWNPNSGDTGGILGDDWRSVNQAKLDYLEPIESPFGGDGDGTVATFAVTLSQAATETVTLHYHTVAGTAGTADFTPTSGSLTFQPGEQGKTISIPITPDTASEANERFTVVLTDAAGATIAKATGTATIIDDDTSSLAVESASARLFSPCIDMAMPVDADLVGIAQASGIENFTLAFMLASEEGIGWQGVGSIADDTLADGTTILSQVQAIQAAGGQITISFGGAAGREAAFTAPSALALQAEYQSVIDRYGITSIDFDIEGAALLDQHSLALRDQAIVGLQAANPDLKISFTLPVLPTGLDANGLAVLQAAKRDGVKIEMVNIMAMDYGQAADNNGQMGLDAINAARATEQQLDTLGIAAKLGITPMIGVNDITSEVFTLADAQALVDFAQSDPRIAQLSMWSVARDNGNAAGAHYASADSSGITQAPFEFSSIFQQFDRSV